MENDKYQRITTRGGAAIGIIALLMFVVVVIFGKSNQEKIIQLSLSEINETVREDAASISDCISSTSVAAQVAFESVDSSDINSAQKALKSLVDNTAVYQALMLSDNLKASDRNGVKYDLSKVDYASELQKDGLCVIYCADDGITGQEAIAIKTSEKYKSDEGSYSVVVFLPVEEIISIVCDEEYSKDAFFFIIDENFTPNVVAAEGTEFGRGDVWQNFKSATFYKSSFAVTQQKMHNNVQTNIKIDYKGDSRYIAYYNIGDPNWVLVVCVGDEYIGKYISEYMKPTTLLKVEITLCLLALIVTFVIIMVLTKAHSNEKSKELEGKADTDLLTGLTNKLSTEKRIAEYIANNPDGQGVLIIIDVDNFKKVNDTMGHAFGDEVLKTLGVRLKSLYRVTDIIGRIGGDEFIVFLKDIKDMAIVEREARKLDRFFKDFEVGEYVKYSVTASLGASVYSMDGKCFEDLYKNADHALYEAKHHGKNRLTFYKEEEKFPDSVAPEETQGEKPQSDESQNEETASEQE